jgi:hypothetical protein
MTKVLAAALGTLTAVLILPAVAHAAPVCDHSVVDTLPGKQVTLPAPDCTGIVGPATTTFSTAPVGGTLSAGPAFVYTPGAGYHDVEALTFTVTDQTGTSAPKTYYIVVDTAPTCTDFTGTVEHNGSLRIKLPCTDADGDELGFAATRPRTGTIAFEDATGDLIYTAAPGYTGTVSFQFYAEDEFGLETDPQTATLTVKPAPVVIVPVTRIPGPLPTPVPPKDGLPVVFTVSSTAKALKPTLSKGLAIVLDAKENSSAKFTVTVDKATARKLKLDRKATGAVTVGTMNVALTAGVNKLTIKLSAKAKRAFKSVKKLKLTVAAVVTDTAGNPAAKTLTVNLKR